MFGLSIAKKSIRNAVVVAAGVMAFGLAQATPITYVFKGTARGVLDTRAGSPAGADILEITPSAYILTATADTTNVTAGPDAFFNAIQQAEITIAGLGTMTLTSPGYMTMIRSLHALSVGPMGTSPFVGGQSGLALTYDLVSSASETPLAGSFLTGSTLTNRGMLVFTGILNQSFSATLATVPSPGTLALVSISLLALVRARRKSVV